MAWHNNIDQNWYSKSQKAKVHVLPCSTPIQTVLQVLPIRLHSYTVLPCRLYSPVDCTPLWTVLPHTAAQAVLAHTGLICTPTQYSPVDCTPMWTVLPHTGLICTPTQYSHADCTPLWTVLPHTAAQAVLPHTGLICTPVQTSHSSKTHRWAHALHTAAHYTLPCRLSPLLHKCDTPKQRAAKTPRKAPHSCTLHYFRTPQQQHTRRLLTRL